VLTVELKHERAKGRTAEVATLREASETVRLYISYFSLGNGNWQGGLVRQNGKRKYMISYNGRVWKYEPKGWTNTTPEITGEELDKPL